jgi:anhydro-N-acetylmuramic acid kinase
MKKTMQAIGLMSGTSLDGLDVCCCTFTLENNKWNYVIDAAEAYDYPNELKEKLGKKAQEMSALSFITFHSAYGKYLGEKVNDFMHQFQIHPDIIASHGHTVFHEPDKRIMFQIGDGAAIAAETGIPTVCDFRRLDIMLGGQGAPLVPIGDRLLFGAYDYCLNIGGFSNISFEKEGKRIAFDISPVNFVINHYCEEIGLKFDEDGKIARKGNVCIKLLGALNQLDFYHQEGPKSLGREWVEKVIYPLIDSYSLSMEDKLCTFYEHAAYEISRIAKQGKLLITGGGAYNKYLVERIDALSSCEVIIPDRLTIEYKEALIFAFLGTLYMHHQKSCLASVTGAKQDNIGGALFKI